MKTRLEIQKFHTFTFIFIITILCSIGCAPKYIQGHGIEISQSSNISPIIVTVSVLPQQYIINRIGQEIVDVNVMVGPGSDPHTYEPKPDQMRALSKSRAYFSVGVEFESAWLDKFKDINPDMMIIDTTRGIELMVQAEVNNNNMHMNNNELHNELDPHIWTSPSLVKIQSKNICETLIDIDPIHVSKYMNNLDEFLADIDALDHLIRETLKGVQNRSFIVFHPAWGYFARDYDLVQIPIEVGGQEPSALELAEVITLAEKEHVKVIFTQPEFSIRTAKIIAEEIGGEVIIIDPLAYDWMANMEYVAETFSRVLK